MQAGRLRHRVFIQEATKGSADAAGRLAETWSNVAEVYAEIQPIRAREQVQTGQVTADVTHKITLRYYEGLGAHHRIKWGSRYFNLVGPPINVDERNRTHELLAIEVP